MTDRLKFLKDNQPRCVKYVIWWLKWATPRVVLLVSAPWQINYLNKSFLGLKMLLPYFQSSANGQNKGYKIFTESFSESVR